MTRISMQGPLTLHHNDEWLKIYAVIVGYTLAYYQRKADLMTHRAPIQVIPLNSGDIKQLTDNTKNGDDTPKCRFSVEYNDVCVCLSLIF